MCIHTMHTHRVLLWVMGFLVCVCFSQTIHVENPPVAELLVQSNHQRGDFTTE